MATTIANVRTMNNPQRAYEYEVEVFGGSPAGSLPIITQRVETVNIPGSSVDTIEVNFKGRKTMYAGRDSSAHTFTVSFYDDESRSVYRYFKNWKDGAINDQITGAGLTRDLYAGEIHIKTFSHDSNTVTATHILSTAFPIELGEIAMTYESSEHIRFDVTFSFDVHTMV